MNPANDRVTAVEVQELGLVIDGATILDNVKFDIHAGEVVGLIGPNGAGKTSLVNVLSGVMKPTNGSVELFGQEVTKWSINKRAKLGLARTFQTSNLFGAMTVSDNVRMAVHADEPRLIKALRWHTLGAADEARVHEALQMVGLDNKRADTSSSLSHGEKRKLEIAMVVASGARLILLDEPMAGVNTEDIPLLVELIAQVRRETGATVLIVEHHLEVVMSLADRIAVMHHGALLSIADPESIVQDPTVQSAYMGEPL